MINENIPKNSKTILYIPASEMPSIQDILDQARAHFGEDIDLDELSITAEHIHVHHLGYDLHDPSDWQDYIIIQKV